MTEQDEVHLHASNTTTNRCTIISNVMCVLIQRLFTIPHTYTRMYCTYFADGGAVTIHTYIHIYIEMQFEAFVIIIVPYTHKRSSEFWIYNWQFVWATFFHSVRLALALVIMRTQNYCQFCTYMAERIWVFVQLFSFCRSNCAHTIAVALHETMV